MLLRALGPAVVATGWGTMTALRPTRWLLPGMLASVGSYTAAWRFYLPQLRADIPRAVAHVLSVGTAGALASWGWGAVVLFTDASSSRKVRALGGFGCLAWLGLANHFSRFVLKGVASTKKLVNESPHSDRQLAAADAIIVLGAGLTGRKPSPVLARRLDRAAQVARQLEAIRPAVVAGQQGVIIVSGGQGADEPCSEAEAMARYLRTEAQLGGADSRWEVLQEDEATSTEENLANSTRILQERGAGTSGTNTGTPGSNTANPGSRTKRDDEMCTIVVVTSDFHVPRTRWHAKHAERDFPGVAYRVVGAETPAGARPAAYVREYVASVVQVWVPQLFSRFLL